MLPLLCACQSEGYQEAVQSQRVLKVGAYLPNSNDTRAQIKYGSGRDETGETFMWNLDDEIFLFNVSNLQDNPAEVVYRINHLNDSDRKNAEFEFDGDPNTGHSTEPLSVKKGDIIIAANGELLRHQNGVTVNGKDIFRMVLGTEANKPQYIVENPDDESSLDESLSFMKDNLRLYDIVTAVEDGQIPDLHFKHLSALLRVTLRNETGEDLYLTKIEFKYPNTNSFQNTTMYFSVNPDMTFEVYDEFHNGTDVYTDEIGTTVSGKNGTADAGGSIANGKSYELYASTVPRIDNDSKGDKFEICLTRKHETNNPYSITLNNFDTVIEAGKRYWFDLTAIITPEGERKLVLTSEWEDWKKQQEEQGKTPEENTQETD